MIVRLTSAADRLEFDDAEAAWIEIADCLEFLDHYADQVHHPLEDRIFDVVLHKGLTPTERHLVFRNLGQHQDLMTRTEVLREMTSSAVAGEVVDAAAFVESLDEYLSLQRRHMKFEEMHIFPLLLARLDNADWNELQRHAQKLTSSKQAGVSH